MEQKECAQCKNALMVHLTLMNKYKQYDCVDFRIKANFSLASNSCTLPWGNLTGDTKGTIERERERWERGDKKEIVFGI